MQKEVAPVSVTAAIDNVAFQRTKLFNQLFPSTGMGFTSSLQTQLHLSQWHALLALETTGDCTTEEAGVEIASNKIFSHIAESMVLKRSPAG
uniref:Uncharacterized protein n=1 Tax=Physcomitrium patens TaxID=3218 RepID=A0A2K1IJR3_PHYPA|nr:hypothetical protein PHYPA_028213 [Physcomitrium patens]